MKLRFLVSAVLMAFALGSCSIDSVGTTLSNIKPTMQLIAGTHINQQQLDTFVLGYDSLVLQPYNAYRYTDVANKVPRRYCTKSQPFTTASPCAKHSVLAALQPILQSVETQRAKLQDAVTGCDVNGDQSACQGMSALILAFNSAVNVARVTASQLGVI